MPRTAVWHPPYERLRLLASLGALIAGGVIAVAGLAFVASFAWPSVEERGRTTIVDAGHIDDFEVGVPVDFPEGKFWLVRQPDDTFLAFYWRDPFKGCTVPWNPHFKLRDGTSDREGWFRNPCHGNTYDLQGNCVFGPCVRDLDEFPVELVGERIVVRTGIHHVTPGDAHSGFEPEGRVIHPATR